MTMSTAAVSQVLPAFDYSALTPDHASLARDAVTYIESRHRGMASAALEIGGKLNEVKAALEHGQFTSWLASSFTMSARNAQLYMQAAAALGDKSEIISHLPVTTLYEIARAPEPIRAKVMDELAAARAKVPASAVTNTIWQAKEDAKREAIEAAKSPAQKKRDKEERAEQKAEWERRNAELGRKEADREREIVRLAEILRSRLGEELNEVAALLTDTGIAGPSLAYRLTDSVYGKMTQFLSARPRTEENWREYLAELETGRQTAGAMQGTIWERRTK